MQMALQTPKEVAKMAESKTLILIPTEFHERSEAVRRVALNLCRRLNGKALLMHVVNEMDRDPAWHTAHAPLIPVEVHYEFLAMKKMQGIVKFFQDNGIETDSVVCRGSVTEVILAEAESRAVDFVVIGSKHRTVASGILGGTVEKIVARSHCPVIVVPHELTRCCGNSVTQMINST